MWIYYALYALLFVSNSDQLILAVSEQVLKFSSELMPSKLELQKFFNVYSDVQFLNLDVSKFLSLITKLYFYIK